MVYQGEGQARRAKSTGCSGGSAGEELRGSEVGVDTLLGEADAASERAESADYGGDSGPEERSARRQFSVDLRHRVTFWQDTIKRSKTLLKAAREP